MPTYRAVPGEPLPLGRRYEHNATVVEFDISAWIEEFGAGSVRLLHQRPGDAAPYPVEVVRTDRDGALNAESGALVLWHVSRTDTAQRCQYGKAELRYYAGTDGAEEFLVKSDVYKTVVFDALGASLEEAPEEERDWLEAWLAPVNAASAAAQEAIANAESAAQEAIEAVRESASEASEAADSAETSAAIIAQSRFFLNDDGDLIWIHPKLTEALEFQGEVEIVQSGDGWAFDAEGTLWIWQETVDCPYSVKHSESPPLRKAVIQDGARTVSYLAFYDSPRLTSVRIPEGVTYISSQAFERCSSLTSVTLPDSLREINHDAFNLCSSLTEIRLPDNLTYLGSSAFRNCTHLRSVAIPAGVNVIQANTFFACSRLESAVMREGLEIIGDSAFQYCENLSNAPIPASVTQIGTKAFFGCESLTSATIPGGVQRVPERAFFDCHALESVVMQEGTEAINGGAFNGCTHLSRVTIPASVTFIGERAFLYCNNLTDVYYAGSEEDRAAITQAYYGGNDCLWNATWHYNWEE